MFGQLRGPGCHHADHIVGLLVASTLVKYFCNPIVLGSVQIGHNRNAFFANCLFLATLSNGLMEGGEPEVPYLDQRIEIGSLHYAQPGRV